MNNNYKRKKRQVKFLLKKIIRFSKMEMNFTLHRTIEKLKSKVKNLLAELSFKLINSTFRKQLKNAFLALSLVYSASSFSQQFVAPQINTFGLNGTEKFIDLDNDGDLDALGQFSTPGHIETYTYYGYYGSYEYEMYVGGGHGLFYRLNNTENGDVNFGENNILASYSYGGYFKIDFEDLDNDGDIDFLGKNITEYTGQVGIIYGKNVGFSNLSPFEVSYANGFYQNYYLHKNADLFLVDIDNDSDIDVFNLDGLDGVIVYYQNLSTNQSLVTENYVESPFNIQNNDYRDFILDYTDIDKDSDVDIFAFHEEAIFVLKNQSTFSPYFIRETISGLDETASFHFKNFDFGPLDDTMNSDLLFIDSIGNFFFSNNSSVNENLQFDELILNPFGLTNIGFYAKPQLLDLDNDGDLDVLVSSKERTAYFENNQITSSLLENKQEKLKFYPNPTKGEISLIKDVSEKIEKITVYNLHGEIVFEKSTNFEKINLTNLEKGSYIVEITTNNQVSKNKLIKL